MQAMFYAGNWKPVEKLAVWSHIPEETKELCLAAIAWDVNRRSRPKEMIVKTRHCLDRLLKSKVDAQLQSPTHCACCSTADCHFVHRI